MSEIIINSGFNSESVVCINNGEIVIDGKVVQNYSGNIKVIIEGSVDVVKCEGSVEVHGNAGIVDCGGSCTVRRSVNGRLDAGGSVKCGKVAGNISAAGSVSCRK